MSFRILFVSATIGESEILKRIPGIKSVDDYYRFNNIQIFPLVTGVGSIATVWALEEWLIPNELPDLVINSGIAGSYKKNLEIGSVVIPVSDCFADAGIEDGEDFLTLAEVKLCDPELFPFKEGKIVCSNRFVDGAVNNLKPVRAISVNTATGSISTIKKLTKKYNPDIETMEGATFFYICARKKVPFLAFRAISNMVETRDKSRWDIPLALSNLAEKLTLFLKTLE
jgi:futalosine hydrolase